MLDWRPDIDPRATDGLLTDVMDMVPTARGYRASLKPTAYGTGTGQNAYPLASGESYPNVMFASRWLSTPGGIVIVGTNKKLSVYDYSNGFVNVSKSGNYSLTSQTFQYGEDNATAFDMCAFGDITIATHQSVVPQYRSALDLTSGTLFADLTGAPQGSVCCSTLNFVFVGDLTGTWAIAAGGSVTGTRDMLAWSAIGDYTNWAVSPTVTQASFAQFTDTPGPITAVVPFRDGIIVFKSDAIYRGRYTGAGSSNSSVWDFERISDQIGCVGHRSYAVNDTEIFFIGKNDIYRFDGSYPQPITQGIGNYIRLYLRAAAIGQQAIQVGHNKPNGEIWFSLPQVLTTATPEWQYGLDVNYGIFVYSYRYDKWGFMQPTWASYTYPIFLPCRTNSEDFRKVTLSAVSSGTQSYTTTTDHRDLHTMGLMLNAPVNFNTTRSNAGTVSTGVYGSPGKLICLKRVTPLYTNTVGDNFYASGSIKVYTREKSIAPINPSNTNVSWTLRNTATLDAHFRADMNIVDRYFYIKHAFGFDHELVELPAEFKPSGEL